MRLVLITQYAIKAMIRIETNMITIKGHLVGDVSKKGGAMGKSRFTLYSVVKPISVVFGLFLKKHWRVSRNDKLSGEIIPNV